MCFRYVATSPTNVIPFNNCIPCLSCLQTLHKASQSLRTVFTVFAKFASRVVGFPENGEGIGSIKKSSMVYIPCLQASSHLKVLQVLQMRLQLRRIAPGFPPHPLRNNKRGMQTVHTTFALQAVAGVPTVLDNVHKRFSTMQYK